MKTLKEIEVFAEENFVPIARKDFIVFLLDLCKKNNYKSFLEIGTAIGYTSIQMAEAGLKVTTFEYFQPRIEVAEENFKDFNLDKTIDFHKGDALQAQLHDLYDVIFIDGAKSKNVEFFEKFSPFLNEGGTIIIDNIDLGIIDLVESEKKKDYYRLQIDNMKKYFDELNDYHVEYNPVGDGIYIIKKK